MSQKMQQLLDLIVNEEMDKANELFHEIVVEKSREIYENMIAEESDEEEMDEATDSDEEEMDEAADEEDADESVEEGFGMEDDAEDHLGGDASDDMVGDVTDHDAMGGDGDDDMGMDGDAPATKDDVQDLEDALAELKAEFEALMGGSAGGDDSDDAEADDDQDADMDMDSDDQDDEEDADDEEDFEESMGFVREYREPVNNDWHKNAQKGETGKMAGAGTGENENQGGRNTKAIVSSGKGKPTTGADAKNIAQGGKGVGEMSGTSTNADKGSRGLVGATKGEFTKGVEKNIASSSKTGMKDGAALNKQGSGYPNNNKTPGPVGSGTGDKAGQTSVGQVKSPLNGAPNRNA